MAGLRKKSLERARQVISRGQVRVKSTILFYYHKVSGETPGKTSAYPYHDGVRGDVTGLGGTFNNN